MGSGPNVKKWAVQAAIAVYTHSFDEETAVFDVTLAADILEDAGNQLLEQHAKDLIINPTKLVDIEEFRG